MNNCKNCKHGIDYGESVDYIYCEKGKRKKSVLKTDLCDKWESEMSVLKEYIIKSMFYGLKTFM